MTGKTILHYRIIEELGRGGMGVVYKAEDTRLDREVALKFLPTNTLTGEEEKKRFKREAKAAAALNHPNICHIYAIDEADEQLFIAMEFIEGKSLAEMITGVGAKHSSADSVAISDQIFRNASPLPVNDAINYATQIAAGLQAAHEKGITHRDIKSANIMVTDKGVVKIMDFGLAKLGNRSMMTKEGTTLGTAAYMSPEQARGEIVDQRTDIWSLGVVLYEMISGRLPFRGEYEQAMVYSILNEEPEPLTALRSNVPIALDGIITKALAKDPAVRYQHVDELPADLKAIDLPASRISRSARTVHSPVSGKRQPSLSGSQMPKRIAFSLMAFLAIASFIIAWFLKSEPTAPPQKVRRFSIAPPQGAHITRDFNISPDGNLLAYIAKDEKDYRIYLRSLDKIEATPLAGTEGVRLIFFSPDSRWLGFLAGHALKKISATGGSPITICAIASPWDFAGASWGNDDRIIFGMANSGLLRVSAEGGNPEPVSQRDAEKGERHHWSPIILLDGKHTLFNIATNNRENSQIAILSLETKEHRVLLEQGGFLYGYIPSGQIVYWRTGGLMVVPFDLEKLEITGSPVRVEENINYAKVSSDGTLFYFPSTVQIQQKLVWVDRKGEPSPLLEESGSIRWPRISPDGKKVAFGFQGDIWIYDTVRQTRSRLTTENGGEPVWTPDGKRLVFWSTRDGGFNLYWKAADGSGKVEPLLVKEQDVLASSWTPDGKTLAFYCHGLDSLHDIWVFPLDGEPSALIHDPFDKRLPKISPDGRWLAYVSNESGRDEIYVQPFPELGKRWLISNAGGNEPVWSKNGQELFYRNGRRMMSVSIQTAPEFQPGTPQVLFEEEYEVDIYSDQSYDVTPDGQRFVMIQSQEQDIQIHVVLNWLEEVKRKMQEKNR